MKEQVIKQLQKLSGHEFIELTSRGNTAIFAAIYCARKITGLGKVLIPDQGGWLSYTKYPKMLEMEAEEVKTEEAEAEEKKEEDKKTEEKK